MKYLVLVLCLIPTLAEASVPLPRPSPLRSALAYVVPYTELAQVAVNPDPFKVNPPVVVPTPPPVVTPVVTPAPVVVTTQPTTFQGEILQWIWAALGALITGLLGKIAFKPPALPGAVSAPTAPAIAAAVVDQPGFRDNIERALLKAVESGIPGRIVQTGLGTIPVVGGLAGNLEPLIRKIVLDTLRKRVGGGEVDLTPEIDEVEREDLGLTSLGGLPQDILHKIEGRILARVEERIAEALRGKLS